MTTRVIKIDPALNLAATKLKAEKIAARAIKKGLSGGYTITTETRTEETPSGAAQQAYLIIEGVPAKFNGYTFVALAEWIGDNVVVTGSPTYDGPAVDRSTLVKGACDHCGTVRSRKSVVVVEDEAGERKQVGKSCVKDYLGNSLALSWFKTGADLFEEFEGYGGFGQSLDDVLDILAIASSVVRQRGWVSKANAEILDKASTASLVRLYLGNEPDNFQERAVWKELRKGYDAAIDEAAAAAALEFGKALKPTSDWVLNLQAVITEKWFDPKYRALVVSLAGVYAQSLVKAAEEAADPVEEAPFGDIGDKVTVTVKAVSSTAFDTAYGITYANTFTGEGYRFKWLTGTRYFDEGETVTLKGTIKKVDEWNGKVFTVLTRCKVVAA